MTDRVTARAPGGSRRFEDGVRPNGGVCRDTAVVADEGGSFHTLQLLELDPFSEPDVPAQADAWDVQPDTLVERVEVRLTVLVEVADVLPVAVEDDPYSGRPISSRSGKSSLAKSYGRSAGTCLSTSGSST